MALFSHFNIGNYSVTADNSKVKPADSFNVLHYNVMTHCGDDGFRPTTTPRVEYVEIVMRCDFTPKAIYDWYRLNRTIQGCIEVEIPDGDNIKHRLIVFEGAQCFFYNEKYGFDQPNHLVTIRLTVDKLAVDNNLYKRV